VAQRIRDGHAHAVALFGLAGQGEVELSTAPQGYRLDVEGDLAERLQATFDRESVASTRQVARVSEATFPGADLIPGRYDERLSGAWGMIAADWRTHEWKPPALADRFHLETHVVEKRDVFLTSDQPLLVMVRRLNAEHGFSIAAMTVADYLDERTPEL
jgi:hypothetical protein